MSDIDTIVVDSLKALDPEWPIREAALSAPMLIGFAGLRDEPRIVVPARARTALRSAKLTAGMPVGRATAKVFASILLRCMSLKVMWWTVPAPSNEVP